MSNTTTQQVNVIYGTPGSGKSKLVRKLVKEHNAYSFSYKDTIIPDFCDFNKIKELYEFLSGEAIPEEATTFFEGGDNTFFKVESSKIVLLQFCYEFCCLINMEEPFKLIIFDGVPKTFGDTIMKNIVKLVGYLQNNGFTVYFVTSKHERLKLFENYFGNEINKIFT